MITVDATKIKAVNYDNKPVTTLVVDGATVWSDVVKVNKIEFGAINWYKNTTMSSATQPGVDMRPVTVSGNSYTYPKYDWTTGQREGMTFIEGGGEYGIDINSIQVTTYPASATNKNVKFRIDPVYEGKEKYKHIYLEKWGDRGTSYDVPIEEGLFDSNGKPINFDTINGNNGQYTFKIIAESEDGGAVAEAIIPLYVDLD